MSAPFLFIPAFTLLAADAGSGSPFFSHLGIAAAFTLLPFLIIACSSFIKISLVLSILRSALGAPGIPPTIVITVLSVVLSMFVMAPVAYDMIASLETASSTIASASDPYGMAQARALFEAAGPTLIDFLRLNTNPTEIDFFADLAGTQAAQPGLRILLPAFMVGELIEAFLIGFLLYVPFLVVDLIAANTLLALGMHMLSPTVVSLPLKLLLFVAVDGWHILVSGLLVNYVT